MTYCGFRCQLALKAKHGQEEAAKLDTLKVKILPRVDGGRTEAKLKNQMVLQPSLTRESNTNFKGCFNRD